MRLLREGVIESETLDKGEEATVYGTWAPYAYASYARYLLAKCFQFAEVAVPVGLLAGLGYLLEASFGTGWLVFVLIGVLRGTFPQLFRKGKQAALDPDQFEASIRILQDKVETGRSEGVLQIENDRLRFEGRETSFAIESRGIALLPNHSKLGASMTLIVATDLHAYRLQIDFKRQAERDYVVRTITRWQQVSAQASVGSTFPPVDVHPSSRFRIKNYRVLAGSMLVTAALSLAAHLYAIQSAYPALPRIAKAATLATCAFYLLAYWLLRKATRESLILDRADRRAVFLQTLGNGNRRPLLETYSVPTSPPEPI